MTRRRVRVSSVSSPALVTAVKAMFRLSSCVRGASWHTPLSVTRHHSRVRHFRHFRPVSMEIASSVMPHPARSNFSKLVMPSTAATPWSSTRVRAMLRVVSFFSPCSAVTSALVTLVHHPMFNTSRLTRPRRYARPSFTALHRSRFNVRSAASPEMCLNPAPVILPHPDTHSSVRFDIPDSAPSASSSTPGHSPRSSCVTDAHVDRCCSPELVSAEHRDRLTQDSSGAAANSASSHVSNRSGYPLRCASRRWHPLKPAASWHVSRRVSTSSSNTSCASSGGRRRSCRRSASAAAPGAATWRATQRTASAVRLSGKPRGTSWSAAAAGGGALRSVARGGPTRGGRCVRLKPANT
mmetsp:Transcript_10407/g.25534  ORF Transcript_10407/g.25534 Transcript_10407/m.25534 type:complete len:353 (-) Transcript_10407:165-1223(-)